MSPHRPTVGGLSHLFIDVESGSECGWLEAAKNMAPLPVIINGHASKREHLTVRMPNRGGAITLSCRLGWLVDGKLNDVSKTG